MPPSFLSTTWRYAPAGGCGCARQHRRNNRGGPQRCQRIDAWRTSTLIDPEDAEGLLEEEYEAAVERAGKVFNIVRSMSVSPPTLRASMELYKTIMFGPSDLSRQDRELLATVVSATNECYY